MDDVNLHLGKPVHPINSPNLPILFIRSLPQSGHSPTTSFVDFCPPFAHSKSRHALCLGFPYEISGSPHFSHVVLRTLAPAGNEYVFLQSG